MNFKIVITLVFAMVLWIGVDDAKPLKNSRPEEWKLDRIECFSTHCHPFSCQLIRQTRTIQLINANCNLTVPHDSAYIHYKLFYRYKLYQPFLVDIHGDFCDAIGNRTKFQPFMEFAVPFIKQFTNLNHSCPFEGNVEVRDLQYNNYMVKGTLLPSGQYRLDMRVYDPRTNDTIFLEQSYLTHSSTFSVKDLAMG